MLMMRARHPGLGPLMLLMRTEPADAHDALQLGDIPLGAKKQPMTLSGLAAGGAVRGGWWGGRVWGTEPFKHFVSRYRLG